MNAANIARDGRSGSAGRRQAAVRRRLGAAAAHRVQGRAGGTAAMGQVGAVRGAPLALENALTDCKKERSGAGPAGGGCRGP